MYSIRWELSDKEHVTITMDVPFDCTAEAVLPMVAKSEKEAVAEVLGSEENGRYLLEPGHYEVSYQLSGWKEKTADTDVKPQFFSKNKKRGERCNFAMGQNEKIVPIIMKRI